MTRWRERRISGSPNGGVGRSRRRRSHGRMTRGIINRFGWQKRARIPVNISRDQDGHIVGLFAATLEKLSPSVATQAVELITVQPRSGESHDVSDVMLARPWRG